MKSLDKVIEASEEHKERFIEVSAKAFFDNPLFLAVFKNPEYRKKKLKPFFDETFRYGKKFGKVIASSDKLEGFLIYIYPENVYRTFRKELKAITFKIFCQVIWPYLTGWSKVDDYLLERHKQYTPFKHWTALAIAIDPKFQGQGHGTTLFNYMIIDTKESNLPIFLDTQNASASKLYERLGFKVLEFSKIPKLDVSSWFMLREPTPETK